MRSLNGDPHPTRERSGEPDPIGPHVADELLLAARRQAAAELEAAAQTVESLSERDASRLRTLAAEIVGTEG